MNRLNDLNDLRLKVRTLKKRLRAYYGNPFFGRGSWRDMKWAMSTTQRSIKQESSVLHMHWALNRYFTLSPSQHQLPFWQLAAEALLSVPRAGEKLHGTCVDKCACKLGRKLPSVWRYISFMEYGLLMGYEGDHGIGISMEYQRNYSTLYVCSLRCH